MAVRREVACDGALPRDAPRFVVLGPPPVSPRWDVGFVWLARVPAWWCTTTKLVLVRPLRVAPSPALLSPLLLFPAVQGVVRSSVCLLFVPVARAVSLGVRGRPVPRCGEHCVVQNSVVSTSV